MNPRARHVTFLPPSSLGSDRDGHNCPPHLLRLVWRGVDDTETKASKHEPRFRGFCDPSSWLEAPGGHTDVTSLVYLVRRGNVNWKHFKGDSPWTVELAGSPWASDLAVVEGASRRCGERWPTEGPAPLPPPEGFPHGAADADSRQDSFLSCRGRMKEIGPEHRAASGSAPVPSQL